MGLKRLGNKHIKLQHIKNSSSTELHRNYGEISKPGRIEVHRQESEFKCKYHTYENDIDI